MEQTVTQLITISYKKCKGLFDFPVLLAWLYGKGFVFLEVYLSLTVLKLLCPLAPSLR